MPLTESPYAHGPDTLGQPATTRGIPTCTLLRWTHNTLTDTNNVPTTGHALSNHDNLMTHRGPDQWLAIHDNSESILLLPGLLRQGGHLRVHLHRL